MGAKTHRRRIRFNEVYQANFLGLIWMEKDGLIRLEAQKFHYFLFNIYKIQIRKYISRDNDYPEEKINRMGILIESHPKRCRNSKAEEGHRKSIGSDNIHTATARPHTHTDR